MTHSTAVNRDWKYAYVLAAGIIAGIVAQECRYGRKCAHMRLTTKVIENAKVDSKPHNWQTVADCAGSSHQPGQNSGVGAIDLWQGEDDAYRYEPSGRPSRNLRHEQHQPASNSHPTTEKPRGMNKQIEARSFLHD